MVTGVMIPAKHPCPPEHSSKNGWCRLSHDHPDHKIFPSSTISGGVENQMVETKKKTDTTKTASKTTPKTEPKKSSTEKGSAAATKK
jgi:hypothetical protein